LAGSWKIQGAAAHFQLNQSMELALIPLKHCEIKKLIVLTYFVFAALEMDHGSLETTAARTEVTLKMNVCIEIFLCYFEKVYVKINYIICITYILA
jgi:hypothetical protein